jgi:hypothetical protein
MRIHHLLAASAAALLSIASWAQTGPVFDPTGSVWLGEQIAAARLPASEQAATAASRRPVVLRVASTKDEVRKTAESNRLGQATRPSTAASAPSPEGVR